MARRSFWDKFWRDERGHDVIWQRPNAFLITWAVCTVLNWFISSGLIERILGTVGFITLLIWAVLEVASGVNYFRRLVGLLVIILMLASRFL
jgi:hypothetical protein